MAHGIAARLIGGHEADPERPMVDLLKEASAELLGAPLEYSEAALTKILSPRYFVEVRRTLGGPAPEETARAAKVSRQQLEADESWWSKATDALARAERALAERSAAL
jgi:argininosuccinate lyase